MNYDYVIDYLADVVSCDGIALSPEGTYNPSYNVALLLHDITKLIRKLKDEANQEQEGR